MITKTQQYLLSKLPTKLTQHIEVISSGCWLWQVNIGGSGHGRVSITINGKRKRSAAHIVIYKFFRGEYAKGLVLDHVYCKHRNCCNPTHVSPVTQQQNVHRGNAVLFAKDKAAVFKLPPEPVPYLHDLLNGDHYVF